MYTHALRAHYTRYKYSDILIYIRAGVYIYMYLYVYVYIYIFMYVYTYMHVVLLIPYVRIEISAFHNYWPPVMTYDTVAFIHAFELNHSHRIHKLST